jgi:DNA (cytosine-5)-methyltransferase 1
LGCPVLPRLSLPSRPPGRAPILPSSRRGRLGSMRGLRVCGIDVFCGAGGLTLGLQKAGVFIVAGIDSDPICEFPFTSNSGARFIEADVREISGYDLANLYPSGAIRLLAGCAPCRPFSPFRRGRDNSLDEEWGLLTEFGRLARELNPELLTMENVPGVASKPVFHKFVRDLQQLGYHVASKSLYCPEFGVPQHRRRLVLLASRIGEVAVPTGQLAPEHYRTVRDAIASLPRLAAGETDPRDRLHRARSVNETNLCRLRSSRPGGTWEDWPEDLRAECHRKKTGSTYRNVYSRMVWDEPAPTITTQAYNFGTGRFGHPEQDRAITPREAALLQTFPRRFRFVRPGEETYLAQVGRLIGNAVPPRLAFFVGKEIMKAAAANGGAEQTKR